MIGEYYYNLNDAKTARRYFQKSKAISAPNSNSENYEGYNYLLWGNTFIAPLEMDSAIFYLEKAIPLLERGKNPHFLHYGYLCVASVLMDRNDLDEAKELLQKAHTLAQQADNLMDLAAVLVEQARLETLQDNYPQARKLLEAADRAIPSTGFSYTRLLSSYYSGQLEFNLGNFNTAVNHLINCLEMEEINDNEDIKANVFSLLGEIYVERSNYDLALKYLLDAIKIMERLGMKQDLCNTYSCLAWLYFKQYNDNETENFAKKSLTFRRKHQCR